MARILLFEDDMFSQQFLLEVLEEVGHTVLLGHLDEKARAQLAAAAVDLVITDLRLRSFTGCDVLAWAATDRPGLPIFGISGAVNRAPTGPHSFAAFLLKPIEPEALLQLVEAITAGNQAAD
jgi:DNA-binding NtrC family response regulator